MSPIWRKLFVPKSSLMLLRILNENGT
uniref:Uncharacterized protein n=1 Tax=Lepeophtheirus salmonis TaxID=72036 RepID=A0A0K2TIZ9_LEPSM